MIKKSVKTPAEKEEPKLRAVTMLATSKARIEFQVLTFEANETYNVPEQITERIALSFIRDGLAKLA